MSEAAGFPRRPPGQEEARADPAGGGAVLKQAAACAREHPWVMRGGWLQTGSEKADLAGEWKTINLMV